MKTFFSPEATVKPVCQIPDMCQITIPDVSAGLQAPHEEIRD